MIFFFLSKSTIFRSKFSVQSTPEGQISDFKGPCRNGISVRAVNFNLFNSFCPGFEQEVCKIEMEK